MLNTQQMRAVWFLKQPCKCVKKLVVSEGELAGEYCEECVNLLAGMLDGSPQKKARK